MEKERKSRRDTGPGQIYGCDFRVCTSPSQPLSTWPMVASASAKRSGSRPFRSTVARQPWKPSREWTSFGSSRYISLETPPMYRSPGDDQNNESIYKTCVIYNREKRQLFSFFKLEPVNIFLHQE